jgi:hypothetical protein
MFCGAAFCVTVTRASRQQQRDCCATHPMCCANTRADVRCSAFVVCALALLLFLRCFRSCCPTGCLYSTLHPRLCVPSASPCAAETPSQRTPSNAQRQLPPTPIQEPEPTDQTGLYQVDALPDPPRQHTIATITNHPSLMRVPHTHTHTHTHTQRCHFQSKVTTRCCFVPCARTCVETALPTNGGALVVFHRSVHSVDRAHGHRSPRCHMHHLLSLYTLTLTRFLSHSDLCFAHAHAHEPRAGIVRLRCTHGR